MVKNINLRDFPKESGVYWITSNDEVVYVGSSKNLYHRMIHHRSATNKGINAERNPALYEFLQSNQFKVEFQTTDNYKQLEQELIEKHNPRYNCHRAFAGVGAYKGREAEYRKEHREKFIEEEKQYKKQYRESHKEEIKQYQKQYGKQYRENHKEEIKQKDKQRNSRLCNYNGETLTLCALSTRFKRNGIEHYVLEAKKYLI